MNNDSCVRKLHNTLKKYNLQLSTAVTYGELQNVLEVIQKRAIGLNNRLSMTIA